MDFQSIVFQFLIALLLIIPAVTAQGSVISPDLEARIADAADAPASELVPVLIFFEERRTFPVQERTAMDVMAKGERQAYVAREIVDFARRQEATVMQILEGAEKSGEAAGINSIEIASAVAARATEGVLRAVAERPEVRLIKWDKAIPVEELRDGMVEAQGGARRLVEHPLMAAPLAPMSATVPEWGVAKIGAPEVWAMGIKGGARADGGSAVVAVLDDGCYFAHPDLAGRMWDGRGEDGAQLYYRTEPLENGGWDYSQGDNDPLGVPIGTTAPDPYYSHGTAVAGIVVGNGAKGRQTGVAPEGVLMCIRISGGVSATPGGNGFATESQIMRGFDFFTDMQTAYADNFRLPDVVTMSADMKFYQQPDYAGWRTLTDNVLALGLVHTNSIGNEGENQGGGCSTNTTPERGLSPVPYNIAVPGNVPAPWLPPEPASSGQHGSLPRQFCQRGRRRQAERRNPAVLERGPQRVGGHSVYHPCQQAIPSTLWDYPQPNNLLVKPDVVAPAGDGMYTTDMGVTPRGTYEGIYSPFGGTSGATPHVAGVALLMKQINPDLTPAQVSMVLQTTAVDLGAQGKDNVVRRGTRRRLRGGAVRAGALRRRVRAGPRGSGR